MPSLFYVEIQTPDHAVRNIQLDNLEQMIGRNRQSCNIRVSDDKVSRVHVKLSQQEDGRWMLVDLDSTNGTLVDGVRIPPAQPVVWQVGQTVVIGDTRLVLRPADDFIGEQRPESTASGYKIKSLAAYNSQTTINKSGPAYDVAYKNPDGTESGFAPNMNLDDSDSITLADKKSVFPIEKKPPVWQGYIGIDDQKAAADPSGIEKHWIGVDDRHAQDIAKKPNSTQDQNSTEKTDQHEFKIMLKVPNQPPKTFVFNKDQIVIGGNKNTCDIALKGLYLIGERLIVKRDSSNVFTVTNSKNTQNGVLDQTLFKSAVWPDEQLIRVGNATLQLKISNPALSRWDTFGRFSKWGVAITFLVCVILLIVQGGGAHPSAAYFFNLFTVGFTALFLWHGLFTLTWMLYGWNNLSDIDNHRSPTSFEKPLLSFTALVPARHEEKVIKDTINAVNRIDYPEELKQILVLCRQDDVKTIAKARETIEQLGQSNIELVVFNSYPINKPHSLNNGLRRARNEIITVFDAEDEPHPDLYHVVNTLMLRENADVVQSGVQLMNYRSHWFSALNVLEYFFWFRSGLPFFSKVGQVTPLGGNSVFFKKPYLQKIGGWDEECLTEDADVGIKLSLKGAKIRIVYDERHATQEETPHSAQSFVKQRARWSQGFLQIFLKGDWTRLPKLRQRFIAGYILFTPVIQAFLFISFPIGLWIAMNVKLSVFIALISFSPLFVLMLQFATHLYGLYDFTRAYKLKFPVWFPVLLLIVYYPYQILLAIGGIRGFYRATLGRNNWEKTSHTNAHRRIVTAETR